MIMRTSVWLFTAPSGSTPAPRRVIDPQARGAEAVPMAQCPTAVPLCVVLDRVAMSPGLSVPGHGGCAWSTHQGGPVPRAKPYPPPHPQGGTPSPPPHLKLPYFLGFRQVGVGSDRCSS